MWGIGTELYFFPVCVTANIEEVNQLNVFTNLREYHAYANKQYETKENIKAHVSETFLVSV